MVGSRVRCPRSLDPVAAHTEAVDREITEYDVAGADDLDGAVSDLAGNHGSLTRRRAGHGYATTGLAIEVGDGQPAIAAGGEQQGIAGLQCSDQFLVIVGVGLERPARCARRAKIFGRHSDWFMRGHRGRHGAAESKTEDGD